MYYKFVLSADGMYETTVGTKAKVDPSGKVQWHPPASYKVSCTIDVTFFPLDEQICYFEFGSWTYNQKEVSRFNNTLKTAQNIKFQAPSFCENLKTEELRYTTRNPLILLPLCGIACVQERYLYG